LYSFLNNYKLAQAPRTKSEYSKFGPGVALVTCCAAGEIDVTKTWWKPDRGATEDVQHDNHPRQRITIPCRARHTGEGKPTAKLGHAGAGRRWRPFAPRSTNAAVRCSQSGSSQRQAGEAIEMAWTVHQKAAQTGDLPLGLGWHLALDGTRWHNGQTGGYHSMILVNRQFKDECGLVDQHSHGPRSINWRPIS